LAIKPIRNWGLVGFAALLLVGQQFYGLVLNPNGELCTTVPFEEHPRCNTEYKDFVENEVVSTSRTSQTLTSV